MDIQLKQFIQDELKKSKHDKMLLSALRSFIPQNDLYLYCSRKQQLKLAVYSKKYRIGKKSFPKGYLENVYEDVKHYTSPNMFVRCFSLCFF